MRKTILFSILLVTTLFLGCTAKEQNPQAKTVAQTIPLTMANLRGHRSLYNEGWFVITSSQKALEFAHEHAVQNAKEALTDALDTIKDESMHLGSNLKKSLQDGVETSAEMIDQGTQRSKKMLQVTHTLAKAELNYAKESFIKAWEQLIKGNLSLAERTEADREALSRIGTDYFKDLEADFSDLQEIAASISLLGGEKLAGLWEDAFTQAKKDYLEAYEHSGEADNSLGGIFELMYGYLKALYHGVVSPTATTAVLGTYETGKNLGKLAYLPVGATISVVERSVQSIGLTLYYSGAIGIKIVSPTIEAGLLSGLSLLSLGSAPLTYVAGSSAGLINQVGSIGVATAAGTAETAIKTTLSATRFVTFVSYDLLKDSAKIFINEASSGVVLGYNALTALPTQLLLAATDTVFFLAWDGPRLVIATAKGDVASHNISELPVGTVIDIKELSKKPHMEVKIISDDLKLLEKVLEQLPKDMKVK